MTPGRVKPSVSLDTCPEIGDFRWSLNIYKKNAKITKNKENVEVFNFGKYKNKSVNIIFKKNPEYYHWIIKSDFPLNTKEKFTEIKLKGISS